MSKPKLVRVTTVPISMDKLLHGQLKFMISYFEVVAISSDAAYLERVGVREGVRTFPIAMSRKITPLADFSAICKLYFFLRKEKPFIILLDGANEHCAPIELLNSSVALADAFPGGGLKIVISWRVNNLDQVPVFEFSSKETLFNAGERQHINPLAANAFLLKPMNLVEMEGAWKTYTSHVSKQFKPQFSFQDLLLEDKPLVDQLSNPLLLRLCMEIFNNKGLKSKPKGFTNLWKLALSSVLGKSPLRSK